MRRSLEQCLPDAYWIQAELSDVRTNSTGHCYLEFVQKDARSNSLIAKARGTIWSNVFRLLKPYFEEATGQAFVSGIKVLVQVTVSFHELYGYSLTVQDIDPTYTLGDMARRRKEILKQLEEEGVLTLNKELRMPRLPQRIAVVSSPTAPDNNYYIKTVRTGIYLIQSRQNGFFNTITLHQCRKKFRIEVKTSRIILQLVAKVTVSGSGWGRNNRNTLRQTRHSQFFI